MMRANEIHDSLGSAWPQILAQLGVPETALRNKHGPCPACGGKDRYRFDNKRGRGDYICSQCGAGDGFKLLERAHGWSFVEARRQVMAAAGLGGDRHNVAAASRPLAAREESTVIAAPTDRVLRLRRDRCAIESSDDAMVYLASRGLWPLPHSCSLKAHATVEYWHEGQRVDRYPALVADVVDLGGELVTCHVTYLKHGRKLAEFEPRKILTTMTGRHGCAVRLMPAAPTLGIAEGIETALSAALLDNVPVWASLNTSLLAKFEPPPGVTTLRVYGDHDAPGLLAALKLVERLQGRIRVEFRIPAAPAKDWNDVLMTNKSPDRGKGQRPHE